MRCFVFRADNFSKWASLVHERVGYVSYKVRGYC